MCVCVFCMCVRVYCYMYIHYIFYMFNTGSVRMYFVESDFRRKDVFLKNSYLIYSSTLYTMCGAITSRFCTIFLC